MTRYFLFYLWEKSVKNSHFSHIREFLGILCQGLIYLNSRIKAKIYSKKIGYFFNHPKGGQSNYSFCYIHFLHPHKNTKLQDKSYYILLLYINIRKYFRIVKNFFRKILCEEKYGDALSGVSTPLRPCPSGLRLIPNS